MVLVGFIGIKSRPVEREGKKSSRWKRVGKTRVSRCMELLIQPDVWKDRNLELVVYRLTRRIDRIDSNLSNLQ